MALLGEVELGDKTSLDDTTQLQGQESVSKSSEGQELPRVLQLQDSLISSQQCWVRYAKQGGSQWLKICLLGYFLTLGV